MGLFSWKKGTTLFELLMALFLFSLFLTGISAMYVKGYQSYSKGSSQIFYFRGDAVGLDTMAADIRQCRQIYNPTLSVLTAGFSPAGTGSPLVIVRHQANPASGAMQREWLGYTLQNNSVIRVIYNTPPGGTFSPTSWTVQETQTIAPLVSALTFAYLTYSSTPFITMSLFPLQYNVKYPLHTLVQIEHT